MNTCREVGSAMGPIPWRDILTYAQFSGLENDLIDPFIQIIREMDSGYLKWQIEKQKKEQKSHTPLTKSSKEYGRVSD